MRWTENKFSYTTGTSHRLKGMAQRKRSFAVNGEKEGVHEGKVNLNITIGENNLGYWEH